jgi:hypothetical protein
MLVGFDGEQSHHKLDSGAGFNVLEQIGGVVALEE